MPRRKCGKLGHWEKECNQQQQNRLVYAFNFMMSAMNFSGYKIQKETIPFEKDKFASLHNNMPKWSVILDSGCTFSCADIEWIMLNDDTDDRDDG